MTDTITDVNALEQHFDEPLGIAVACMLDSLDKYQRQFIELSPFACIATADSDGQPTISPKGDAPGFMKVIDEHTLVMPDRIGNNKAESFHNLVENPKMGLIFMIPGVRETLRISGSASITTDQELLKFAQVGKNPVKTGLLINITKSYFHCGKAMIRSKLWDEKSKLARGVLPSFGEIFKEEAKLTASTEEAEALLENAYSNELY
ncbi:MAG: PPOX class probable FMN-dependent enzyme [Planctomycetota bacterium]|jgi:PPOX class probable FMN-dependent enzyme